MQTLYFRRGFGAKSQKTRRNKVRVFPGHVGIEKRRTNKSVPPKRETSEDVFEDAREEEGVVGEEEEGEEEEEVEGEEEEEERKSKVSLGVVAAVRRRRKRQGRGMIGKRSSELRTAHCQKGYRVLEVKPGDQVVVEALKTRSDVEVVWQVRQ